MRRLSFGLILVFALAVQVLPVRAGGHGGGGHGGGWHGGGGWGYGHGYVGCGGWWPFALGVGLGVAASYPLYTYSQPVYTYPAVTYSYPSVTYVYQPAPAYAQAPVATTATVAAARPVSSAPTYTYTQPQEHLRTQQPQRPAAATVAPPSQAHAFAADTRPTGTWIQDTSPDRYIPEASRIQPSLAATSPMVTVRQSGAVPVYVVSR